MYFSVLLSDGRDAQSFSPVFQTKYAEQEWKEIDPSGFDRQENTGKN